MSEYAARKLADKSDNSYLYGPDSLFGPSPAEAEEQPQPETSPGVVLGLGERAMAVEAIMSAFNRQSRAGGAEKAAEHDTDFRNRFSSDVEREQVVDGLNLKANLSKIDVEEAMDTIMKDEELIAAGFNQQDVNDERQLMSMYARVNYGPNRPGVNASKRHGLVRSVRRTAERVIDESYDPTVM